MRRGYRRAGVAESEGRGHEKLIVGRRHHGGLRSVVYSWDDANTAIAFEPCLQTVLARGSAYSVDHRSSATRYRHGNVAIIKIAPSCCLRGQERYLTTSKISS